MIDTSKVKKFVGQKKIEKMEDATRKTFLGKDVIKVFFKDSTSQEMPLEVLEIVSSGDTRDLTVVRDALVDSLIPKITALLLEAEVAITDIEYILSKVASNTNMHLDKAGRMLWGKELSERTMYDLHNILKTLETK